MPSALGAEEELWRQRVGPFAWGPRLMREAGFDPALALAPAGLEESAFAVPENTIPYAAMGRFLHGAAQLTGWEHFGLRVGQGSDLKSLGLLGELMRHSSTVREALRFLMVYHHLNSQRGAAFMHEEGAVAELGYAIYHRSVVGRRQLAYATLAMGVSYMRELCSPAWVPTEVIFAHAAPADASPFRGLFRCTVRFNAERNALCFPRHWLDLLLPGADAAMLRKLEAQANALPQPDLVDKLRRSLRVRLLHRVTTGDDVAEMLALHRRTLNRRLQALGTTFREVLEDVRFDAACELLASTELTLEAIADALGYASVSPFTRAFRRRVGVAPGQWRRDGPAQP